MKTIRKLIGLILVLTILAGGIAIVPAEAALKPVKYQMSAKAKAAISQVYKKYNFAIGWGLYDISGSTLKEVASYNVSQEFQSNCTIKAAMLLYICKLIDSGKLSKDKKLSVNKSSLHYNDFSGKSGKYSVEYLLTKMINVSNNVAYEVFLRYVTKESFNNFLKGLGSGTVIKKYTFMGNCKPKDRAIEWMAIYNYCHSGAKNSVFAWKLLTEAKYSPVRDGLQRTVAHKSGWYNKKGTKGTAADCAVVKTDNGGCYLVVIFTKNNKVGNYSEKLISDLAVSLDKVWNEYYSFQRIYKMAKTAKF